jgi:2,3-bisphosphoglycerate-dependent phosphoglycerate mutase
MPPVAHTLVLLRHGESEWNLANLFTGWVDVDLTDKGRAEAQRGGALMRDAGVRPTVLHTSLQLRAIRTAELALESMERTWLPVRRTWRLNERHYGALQGKDKKATREQYGDEQLLLWRRSYDVPPPELDVDDPAWGYDERYAFLPRDVLPRSECLKDVVERMLPYWYDGIVPDLRARHVVLVAAHGNSLRALVMVLERLSPEGILAREIATGVPIIYHLNADATVAKKLDLAA